MLTRRDFRWIAIGLVAFCLYDYWDISQHKVPQNTVTFAPDPRFRGHPIELTTYRIFLFSPQDDHVKEIPVLTRSLEGAWAAVGWVK
jgi:hypothetical protein